MISKGQITKESHKMICGCWMDSEIFNRGHVISVSHSPNKECELVKDGRISEHRDAVRQYGVSWFRSKGFSIDKSLNRFGRNE